MGRRALAGGALLLAPLLGCAREGAPPGGPPDHVPPVVVSTSPDTFATVEAFDHPVVIRFSERISERPTRGSSLDEAVVVSPTTSALEVNHGRSSLEISLANGFEAGHVYRVRVLPVIQDLFSNPMLSPYELVFSTGPSFSAGVLAGTVRDRISGATVAEARVQARPAGGGSEDSLTYAAMTDEEGIYTFRYLPPGSYELLAFVDRNRNLEADGAEPRALDSVRLAGAADTVLTFLEVLAPDTTPARVTRVAAVDSASLQIQTDDYLDPATSLEAVGVQVGREGGAAPPVDSLLHAYEWEARSKLIRARAAAARDTAAPDTLSPAARGAGAVSPDTGAAAPDTAAPGPSNGASPDTAGRSVGPAPRSGVRAGRPAPPPDTLPADSSTGPYRAGPPPRSEQSLYVLLARPMEQGVQYTVRVSGIVNINEVEDGGGVDSLTWTPPPPDTAAAPADTTGASPDTTGVPADTTTAPADSAAPAPQGAGGAPAFPGPPP